MFNGLKYFLIYYSMSLSSNEYECAFCLEPIYKFDYVILDCNHKYHYKCIQDWINTTKKLTKLCPQCCTDGEIIQIVETNKPNTYKPMEIPANEQTTTNNIFSCCTIL